MRSIPPENEIAVAARELGHDPDTMPPYVRTKVIKAMHLAADEGEQTTAAETSQHAFAARCVEVQDALIRAGVWAPTIERVVGALAPTLWKEAARHE